MVYLLKDARLEMMYRITNKKVNIYYKYNPTLRQSLQMQH